MGSGKTVVGFVVRHAAAQREHRRGEWSVFEKAIQWQNHEQRSITRRSDPRHNEI